MTTRRRRTGSESLVEETQGGTNPSAALQQFHNTPVYIPQVVPTVGGGLPWMPLASGVTNSDAYYKKTDRLSPNSINSVNSSPCIGQSGQQWQSPSAYKTFTPQSSGRSFAVDHNQLTCSGFNSGTPNQGLPGKIDKSGKSWNSATVSDGEEMASRDRTQEFLRIVRSQQGSVANGSIPHRESKRPRDLRQYADFMQRAKMIGRNISSTYAKLEKLALLAQKRTLYDDSQDQEIQELTGIIRHDLTSLTKQLEDVKNRSHGAQSPNGMAHLQKHSANLVGSLQTKVASITQQFKDVLEVRTENLKKQAERHGHFAGGAVGGDMPAGSLLLADEAAAASGHRRERSDGHVSINMTQQQQQLFLMEEQDQYLQSRADTMRTIESTIVELGQMFTQLATMVKEQEEFVERIDTNVEDAELNVEAAHSELLKYFKSISSNRWLMVKGFGIIIVFFIIFIVFMA